MAEEQTVPKYWIVVRSEDRDCIIPYGDDRDLAIEHARQASTGITHVGVVRCVWLKGPFSNREYYEQE